jgi:HK97 family phage major capsid protein
MFIQLRKDHLGQKAGARIDVDQPVAQTLLQQGIAEPVAGDPLAPVLARSMESLLGNLTQSLNTSIDAVLKEFAQAQTRSRRNATAALFGPGGDGDPKRTFGGFLLAVRRGDHKALEEMGSRFADWENVERKAALTSQSGAQGGFTVPAEYLPRLLALSAENSVVEARATRIPMASNAVEVPCLDVTTAPTAGETAYFGGLQASWTEEAAQTGEEEPTFKQLRLTAHELSGYTLASNVLLADNAVGLESLLLELFGRALGWHKDHAFLRGNGAGKPLGVLNAGALITVSPRSGASAFALSDAANMVARLLPGYDPAHTCWAMHPTVLPKLFQMADAEGHIVFLDNARGRPTMVLFGLPVVVTEKLPALNTVGDVLLLDLRHYLIGDRQDVEIAFSEHYRFINNQGCWRFICRVDGQPWLRGAVTLADGSSTLSAFVGLAAG